MSQKLHEKLKHETWNFLLSNLMIWQTPTSALWFFFWVANLNFVPGLRIPRGSRGFRVISLRIQWKCQLSFLASCKMNLTVLRLLLQPQLSLVYNGPHHFCPDKHISHSVKNTTRAGLNRRLWAMKQCGACHLLCGTSPPPPLLMCFWPETPPVWRESAMLSQSPVQYPKPILIPNPQNQGWRRGGTAVFPLSYVTSVLL